MSTTKRNSSSVAECSVQFQHITTHWHTAVPCLAYRFRVGSVGNQPTKFTAALAVDAKANTSITIVATDMHDILPALFVQCTL
jgi:hypothetical protein